MLHNIVLCLDSLEINEDVVEDLTRQQAELPVPMQRQLIYQQQKHRLPPPTKMMKKVFNGIYIHSTVCITSVQYVFFKSERLLSQFQSWLLIFIKGRPFIPCNLTPSNGRISWNALNPWDMLRINSKVHLEPRLAFQTKEPRELKFQGQTLTLSLLHNSNGGQAVELIQNIWE